MVGKLHLLKDTPPSTTIVWNELGEAQKWVWVPPSPSPSYSIHLLAHCSPQGPRVSSPYHLTPYPHVAPLVRPAWITLPQKVADLEEMM